MCRRLVARFIPCGLAAAFVLVAAVAPARAQGAVSPETAAAVKAAFLADLDNLQTKFLGLAEAFPQEKYTWRPMEGVRSVSEVLIMIAMEGFTFIPGGLGAKPMALGTPEEVAKIRALTDKAQIIDYMKKGFAYAKSQLEALDPAVMAANRKVSARDARESTVVEAAVRIGADLHEHLGQTIAYARTNRVVPPWSK